MYRSLHACEIVSAIRKIGTFDLFIHVKKKNFTYCVIIVMSQITYIGIDPNKLSLFNI